LAVILRSNLRSVLLPVPKDGMSLGADIVHCYRPLAGLQDLESHLLDAAEECILPAVAAFEVRPLALLGAAGRV